MSNFIFEIKDASVFRGRTQVFEHLNLTLKAEQHVAILGPNGAGKTTLLKLLLRELYPVVKDGSYIKLFGHERVDIWALREQIGVVSQDFQNNYRSLATGFEVVLSAFFGSIGMHGHMQPSDLQKAQVEQQLSTLGITYLRDKMYLELSTGQQRRLLLARALIHQPEVLIFDEPTSGLDVKASFELMSDLRRLAQAQVTVILVTHHVNEIFPEIERLVLLKDGAIFADGEKAELLTAPTLSDLFDTPLTVSESQGHYHLTPRLKCF